MSKAVYKMKERISGIPEVTKDGHTMFFQDVVFDLNNLYLLSKALKLDLELTQVSLDHKTTLLVSCEKALEERDAKIKKLIEL